MKKILFLLLAFTLLSSCSNTNFKKREYSGEVTYKWCYHLDNSSENRTCLEVSVNNGEMIFRQKVSELCYNNVNIGDSVDVLISTPVGIYKCINPWPFITITIHKK